MNKFIFNKAAVFTASIFITNARQHIFLGDLFRMVICKTLSTCQLWYKLNLHQQILQLIYTNKYHEILTSMNWRDNSLVYFLIISLKLLICVFAHWPQDFDWNDRLNEANISSMGLFHYVSWNGYHSQRNLFWLDSRQSLNSVEWVFQDICWVLEITLLASKKKFYETLWFHWLKNFQKNHDSSFFWVRFNNLKATEPPWGDSLLFINKFAGVLYIHLFDLGRMKSWVSHGTRYNYFNSKYGKGFNASVGETTN